MVHYDPYKGLFDDRPTMLHCDIVWGGKSEHLETA